VSTLRFETVVPRVRAAVVRHRYRLLAGLVALAAGVAVFVLAHELFPYHSSNNDEGVYLQQAAMLLEGQLRLRPGSPALREAFHPWFFVEDDRGFYSKYSPVPSAVFALGKLAGGYRLALFGVAAANVALAYGLAAAAFDERTGLLAAATMAAAPLFLLNSAVFLPYAPTTALNLLFALSYVRSVRRGDGRYAALAGVAVGLAFFARPYTALLFALPFVAHAGVRTLRAFPDDRPVAVRHGLTAALGLAFVGVTLGYNAVVTGSPLLFPYQAFAPLDGIGFGQRRILGHEAVYTPGLALRANAIVVWTFATRWFTAGPVGTLAALVGVAAAAAGARREGFGSDRPLGGRALQALLVAVVASVVLGNVYFWGNLNVLGRLSVPGDGLVSVLGPFYHFDLLAPLSAFAAHGTLSVADRVRAAAREHASGRAARVAVVVALAVSLPVVGVAQADALGPPVETNAAYTEKYDRAYAPFERAGFENALVFLPPEYGEWRNHPFQYLRNDPAFDGPAVYAMSLGPATDFALVDAYPDRTYYRYRYHGAWTPDPDDQVVPVLERVEVRETASLTAATTVAVPERVSTVTVGVAVDGVVHRYDHAGDPPGALTVDWTVTPDGVTVAGEGLAPRTDEDAAPVPIEDAEVVALTVTLTEPSGATLTYREELTVVATGDRVRAVWPPESSVCTLVTECGLDGTYVPDRPDTRPSGIATNTSVADGNA